jgi:hypothetical protein
MLETGPIFVPQQPTFCGSQNCQKWRVQAKYTSDKNLHINDQLQLKP